MHNGTNKNTLKTFFDTTTELSASDKEALQRIAFTVSSMTGNQLLGENKIHMVTARLTKRLTELNLQSISDYEKYFNNNREKETDILVSLLTTHHTYFFREFSQFEHLLQALPRLINIAKQNGRKELTLWSAASSRGQEAYSLAMFLYLHLPQIDPSMSFKIIGTDIDQQSVDYANNGVYPYVEIKSAPIKYISDHWARGTGEISDFVKAKKSIKSKVHFYRHNILNVPSNEIDQKYDVIFCRNLFIYFNSDQIKKAVHHILNQMHEDSIFFIGISENLYNLDLPLESVGPSAFKKRSVHKTKSASIHNIFSNKFNALPTMPNPLRVVCVDDSSTILTLLKQMLDGKNGYEVVATAKNGIEAARLVEQYKPDLVTLDIHMPEMNGIEYLQRHFSSSHPPVVMVTSVSRDDKELALKALQLGASDYIEKPSLNNFNQTAAELDAKLKSAWRAKAFGTKISHNFDQNFAKEYSFKNSSEQCVALLCSTKDIEKVILIIQELNKESRVSKFLLIDDYGSCVDALKLQSKLEYDLKALGVNILDAESGFSTLLSRFKLEQLSLGVIGTLSPKLEALIRSYNGLKFILEDNKISLSSYSTTLRETSKVIAPVSSYAYTLLQLIRNYRG